MSKFKIRHITRYTYEEPVRDSANQIMLYPIKDDYQEVANHTIAITGNPPISTYIDYFGNEVGTFTHPFPHSELVIDSKLEVITHPRNFIDDTNPVSKQWELLEKLKYQLAFIDYYKSEPFIASEEIKKVIEAEHCRDCTPLTVVQDFTKYIFENFKYQKGITTVESTLDEIWKLQSGVCQDFAHMLLYMLRLVNIPSRYVSGYICSSKSGMRGEGATHAWIEVYLPNQGWIGFDPTNNCMVNDSHVRLAVGKNFTDCSPVRGTYRGTAGHTLDVTVSVQYEDGSTLKQQNEVIETSEEPVRSFSRNSFRKFQEMQMQQ
jgi:transglutaminase-like putative cysteine protease